MQSELGDLYVSRLVTVDRHDCQGALGAVDLEQEHRPVGGAAFEVDRCDGAAFGAADGARAQPARPRPSARIGAELMPKVMG